MDLDEDDGLRFGDVFLGEDDRDDLELLRLVLFLDVFLFLFDIGDFVWREGWLVIVVCGIIICCVLFMIDCIFWIWIVCLMLFWLK